MSEGIESQMVKDEPKSVIKKEDIIKEYLVPEYVQYFCKKCQVSTDRIKTRHLWTSGGIARKRIYILEPKEVFAGITKLFEKESYFITVKVDVLLTVNGEPVEQSENQDLAEETAY